MLYKQKIEARNTKTVLEFIAPGSTVIDVGANIGYFTLQLARQVGATGEVIAIEPEPNNFARLSQVVARAKLQAKISLHQVAAADVMGQLYLKLDPYNPANHQLSDSGVSVEATTIDDLVGALGNPTITLIKIDVQGAEKKVLQGAVATIMRSHPTIFCEVDESGLRHFQSSALDLTNYLCDLGYTAYGLGPKHGYYPIDVSKMMQGLPTAWYTDFLFLRNVTS